MAPPEIAPLLENVPLMTVNVPLLRMAPPPLYAPALLPLAMVRLARVKAAPEFTTNTCVVPPPLSVMRLPPSMLVSTAMIFWLVTVIVTGLVPQLKVTLPPPARAASNADSVQLPAVPVPTTASARTGRGDHAAATSSTASVRATTARITPCFYPAWAAK